MHIYLSLLKSELEVEHEGSFSDIIQQNEVRMPKLGWFRESHGCGWAERLVSGGVGRIVHIWGRGCKYCFLTYLLGLLASKVNTRANIKQPLSLSLGSLFSAKQNVLEKGERGGEERATPQFSMRFKTRMRNILRARTE